MADVDIGEYRHRVTFRNYTKVQDETGGHSETGVDFLTTWAKIMSKSGSRNFTEGFDTQIDRKDIWVYSRQSLTDALKVDTRIIYNGKEYSIDHTRMVDEIKGILHFEVSGKI